MNRFFFKFFYKQYNIVLLRGILTYAYMSSYEAGVGAMSQSQFDKAVSCFSKAILLQSHQVEARQTVLWIVYGTP